jgi:hypothetical protein
VATFRRAQASQALALCCRTRELSCSLPIGSARAVIIIENCESANANRWKTAEEDEELSEERGLCSESPRLSLSRLQVLLNSQSTLIGLTFGAGRKWVVQRAPPSRSNHGGTMSDIDLDKAAKPPSVKAAYPQIFRMARRHYLNRVSRGASNWTGNKRALKLQI